MINSNTIKTTTNNDNNNNDHDNENYHYFPHFSVMVGYLFPARAIVSVPLKNTACSITLVPIEL